jgi:hypothetical protein
MKRLGRILIAGAIITMTVTIVAFGATYNSSGTASSTAYPGNRSPNCASVGPGGSLWPPDHVMVQFTATGVTDPDGDPITTTIVSITSNEPVNGQGDGDTSPDWIVGPGNKFSVRRERSGGGNGRVYTITVQGADTKGGTCTGPIQVRIPHDQS